MKDIFLKPGTYSAVLSSKENLLKGNGQSLQKFLANYLSSTSVCCTKNFVGNSLTVSQISLTGKGSVTQATGISAAVSVDAYSGIIETVSTTLAAETTATFTVTNADVLAASIVVANILNYSGTQGIPVVRVDTVSAGSFKLAVSNAHSTSALNGVLKVGFAIL